MNAGILPAFQNHSSSSHGDMNIRENRDVSPGAPEDLEIGPDPPGFSDSEAEDEDGPQMFSPPPVGVTEVEDESVTKAQVVENVRPTIKFATSPSNTSNPSSPSLNNVRAISKRENSIKLIVTGAPATQANNETTNETINDERTS